jgi:hypothetical protein
LQEPLQFKVGSLFQAVKLPVEAGLFFGKDRQASRLCIIGSPKYALRVEHRRGYLLSSIIPQGRFYFKQNYALLSTASKLFARASIIGFS